MDSRSRPGWDDSADGLLDEWNPVEADDGLADPGGPDSPPASVLADVSIRFEARGPAVSGLEGDLEPEQERRRPRRMGLQFPPVGEVLCGFRLVGELGRGAFARVYLAEQGDLAGRLVALKVSRAIGDEPYALARLQHAHIVPIHSVHDDPQTGLRLLCMPYLGGANLAQVLEMSGARLPSAATGESLVDALDRLEPRLPSISAVSRHQTVAASLRGLNAVAAQRAATRNRRSPSQVRSMWWKHLLRWTRIAGVPVSVSLRDEAAGIEAPLTTQPARQYFRAHSYVQAAVWIVARLAEALEHAHTRGLLHRDLKPSNVLIAADGSPMLLDFNLSADVAGCDREGSEQALLGGTLPYMAPEHLDAFNPEGLTPASAVDERSDLYALGLILFEMLSGRHPFSDPDPDLPMPEVLRRMVEERRRVPSLRGLNPEVPHSLDAILRKCLDPEPVFRYQRAGELAEDLRRFLDDRPLKHAPEPSLTEQAAKWLRRHPEARSSTTIGLLSTFLIVAVATIAWLVTDHVQAAAEGFRRKQFEGAFRECQILLNTTTGPHSHWRRGLEIANRELRDFGLGEPGPERTRQGGLLLPMPHLAESERQALAEQVAELILLKARAETALAVPQKGGRRKAALESVLRWLDRAETIDPHPTSALYEERARVEEALGRSEAAGEDRTRALQQTPRTARDYYLLGTSSAAQGRLDRAEALLSRSVALDSRGFWAWFALGLCHYDQGRFAESATDFAACTILAPNFAWPYLNRGLALARQGRLTEAKAAYDQALAANPDFVEALVDRALVSLEVGEATPAEQDLERAIVLGDHDPGVLAAHAEALARLGRSQEARRQFDAALSRQPRNPDLRVARGFYLLRRDPKAARADFETVLRTDPGNARAHLGLARLVRSKQPESALEHLDQALGIAPDLLDAVQLRALVRARAGDLEALDDVDRLVRTPTAHNLYNAACALALLGEGQGDPHLSERALNLLGRAIDAGFPASEAAEDPDFASLQAWPEFQALVGQASAEAQAGESRNTGRVPRTSL